jgi:hypothetical protein
MSDPTPNGAPPPQESLRGVGQVVVTELEGGGVRLTLPPGQALDRSERLLYGALKFIERGLAALRLQQALQPRVAIAPSSALPRGPMLG